MPLTPRNELSLSEITIDEDGNRPRKASLNSYTSVSEPSEQSRMVTPTARLELSKFGLVRFDDLFVQTRTQTNVRSGSSVKLWTEPCQTVS